MPENHRSEDDYEVGPGRPPKQHQWRPGQSGNPGGRPKGESITAAVRRILEREHNGRRIGELLAERLVKEALSGKYPFLKEVLERTEGKIKEQHELHATQSMLFYLPSSSAIREEDIPHLPPGSKVICGVEPDAI